MIILCWASVTMGLFVSTIDTSSGKFAVILAIIIVLPQLLLSGGLGPDFYKGMSHEMRCLADVFPARWGLEMLFTAFYFNLSLETAPWIPEFIRQTIGFDFGEGVYEKCMSILILQSFLWVSLTSFILYFRNRR